jgi:hypothetical protein
VGIIVYLEARDSWSRPLEIEAYPEANRIAVVENEGSDFQRFVQRVEASTDTATLMEDIENHYNRQMDNCMKNYEDVVIGEAEDTSQIIQRHVRTDCYKEKTHNILGFIQFAHVAIYPGTVFISYACEEQYDACTTEFQICSSQGENISEETRRLCKESYDSCQENNRTTCQIPAVFIEMQRSWNN